MARNKLCIKLQKDYRDFKKWDDNQEKKGYKIWKKTRLSLAFITLLALIFNTFVVWISWTERNELLMFNAVLMFLSFMVMWNLYKINNFQEKKATIFAWIKSKFLEFVLQRLLPEKIAAKVREVNDEYKYLKRLIAGAALTLTLVLLVIKVASIPQSEGLVQSVVSLVTEDFWFSVTWFIYFLFFNELHVDLSLVEIKANENQTNIVAQNDTKTLEYNKNEDQETMTYSDPKHSLTADSKKITYESVSTNNQKEGEMEIEQIIEEELER